MMAEVQHMFAGTERCTLAEQVLHNFAAGTDCRKSAAEEHKLADCEHIDLAPVAAVRRPAGAVHKPLQQP